MNKKIWMACLIGFMSFFASNSNAQVSVNFNVAAQPLWGPTGYNQASNYYLPDIDTYYNVPNKQYIYLQDNKWQFSNTLPSRYSGYNLYNGYKVVMNNPRPYLSYKTDRVKYAKYKGYKGKQPAIRYSNDPKYFVIKGHPKHPLGGAPGQAKKTSISSSNRVHVASKGNTMNQGNGNNNNQNKGGNKEKGKGKH